jgi:putative ABC transport system substrate-binding protein
MARMDDADEHGFVASLARPGGNITGLSIQSGELSGKGLALLKEAVPTLTRVAVLWDATGTANKRRTLEQAAHTMGVQLHVFEVRSPEDFDGAFAAAHAAQAEGLVILGSPVVTQHTPRLAALAAHHRLPAIYFDRRFPEAGGLMAYGPQESDSSWGERRAAVFVDKILKGVKPADLPVERPRQFELVLNLKTAKALGLTIPPSVLFQATEVLQ